jgi:hypothetical protein
MTSDFSMTFATPRRLSLRLPSCEKFAVRVGGFGKTAALPRTPQRTNEIALNVIGARADKKRLRRTTPSVVKGTMKFLRSAFAHLHLALAVAIALLGCSSRHAERVAKNDVVLPDACETYATHLRDCLLRSDSSATELATARADAVRATFAAQAARGEQARASLAESCAGSLAQITKACPR